MVSVSLLPRFGSVSAALAKGRDAASDSTFRAAPPVNVGATAGSTFVTLKPALDTGLPTEALSFRVKVVVEVLPGVPWTGVNTSACNAGRHLCPGAGQR